MATQNELVYSVKELLKDHTDNSLISNAHVLFQLKAFRALLLRQLYSDRARAYDYNVIQTFCLEMEVADSGLCGTNTGCKILKSKKQLPELLSLKGRAAFVRAAPPIIGAEPFDIIKSSNISNCLEDEYGTNSVFIKDRYVYLVGQTPSVLLVKCISVSAIFVDPEDLYDYNTCKSCGGESEPCYTEDSDFPMPGFLITPLINGVLKEFLTVKALEQRRDVDNNDVPE